MADMLTISSDDIEQDAEIERQQGLYQELGCIEIEVWRKVGGEIGRCDCGCQGGLNGLHPAAQIVHEKAVNKQAVTLHTSSAIHTSPSLLRLTYVQAQKRKGNSYSSMG